MLVLSSECRDRSMNDIFGDGGRAVAATYVGIGRRRCPVRIYGETARHTTERDAQESGREK